MRARRGGLGRRARTLAMYAARRTGLLPSGTPDRLGDDDRLAGARFDESVMVYFPDTRQNLYQLQQWYGPLRALDERHRVVVVLQDSRAARVVREELGLPAYVIAHYSRLDDVLSRSEVKLALYVNQSPQNFSALRFTSLVHVFLNHGESDKGVSVSNQVKAYDFYFVAGQAAVDRVAANVLFYDAAAHCMTIGRPQLDFDLPPAPRARPEGEPHTVLYAPTWEGAQPSLSYGSVRSHGPALVRELLDSGRFRVLYRPHPLNGLLDGAYGDADAEVRRLVAEAAASGGGHAVDAGRTLGESFADADVLVCDVSAVAMDFLPYGRPLVVTVPASAGGVPAGTRLLDVVPRLPVDALRSAVDLLAEQVERDPTREARVALTEYYLGDTTPGAATRRFVDACTTVMALRDEACAAAAGVRSTPRD